MESATHPQRTPSTRQTRSHVTLALFVPARTDTPFTPARNSCKVPPQNRSAELDPSPGHIDIEFGQVIELVAVRTDEVAQKPGAQSLAVMSASSGAVELVVGDDDER